MLHRDKRHVLAPIIMALRMVSHGGSDLGKTTPNDIVLVSVDAEAVRQVVFSAVTGQVLPGGNSSRFPARPTSSCRNYLLWNELPEYSWNTRFGFPLECTWGGAQRPGAPPVAWQALQHLPDKSEFAVKLEIEVFRAVACLPVLFAGIIFGSAAFAMRRRSASFRAWRRRFRFQPRIGEPKTGAGLQPGRRGRSRNCQHRLENCRGQA